MKSIGHEIIKEKLRNIVQSGNISNAYLFTGKEGIGKKLVAMEFSKSILCDAPSQGISCEHCSSCLTFHNNADFKCILPEKDVIKVDTIRDFIKEISLMPTISKRKVFIIDDADKMNEQAQNALLKVLEEPPKYATIILIASGKEKLLNTIKSRVVEFQFDCLNDGEVKEILLELLDEEQKDLDLEGTIAFSGGSVLRALEWINDGNLEIAKELSEIFLEKDFLKMNRKWEEIKSDKNLKTNVTAILEKVMYIYYLRLKEDFSFDYHLIEALEKTIENMRKNANVDLALDMLMIEISGIAKSLV